jgi:hypothetical protein
METTYFDKKCILINIQQFSERFISIDESKNIYVVNNKREFLSVLDKQYIFEKNNFYSDIDYVKFKNEVQ